MEGLVLSVVRVPRVPRVGPRVGSPGWVPRVGPQGISRLHRRVSWVC